MKKLIIITYILSILFSLTTMAQVSYGDCLADPGSKVYSQDVNFTAPYPKVVKFSCEYKCLGSKGYESIRGNHSVTVRNISDDAKLVVCQGVKVERRAWGYDFAGVDPFYSYQGSAKSVKTWAFTRVDRDNASEKALLLELKDMLYQVASGYFVAAGSGTQFSFFRGAAVELLEVSGELPNSTKKLDELVAKYQGYVSKTGDVSKDKLVNDVLKSAAKFRFR